MNEEQKLIQIDADNLSDDGSKWSDFSVMSPLSARKNVKHNNFKSFLDLESNISPNKIHS